MLGPRGLFAIEVKNLNATVHVSTSWPTRHNYGNLVEHPHHPPTHHDPHYVPPPRSPAASWAPGSAPRTAGLIQRDHAFHARRHHPRRAPPGKLDTVPSNHQLRLYNSLGGGPKDFVPAAQTTGMYSCGPTVYSFPHLGNMRPYVFADTLRRALRWRGTAVRHVVNITDVGHAVADSDTGEDKLKVAAARERRSVLDVAAFYADAFFVDTAALNILPADEYPRASAYVGR